MAEENQMMQEQQVDEGNMLQTLTEKLVEVGRMNPDWCIFRVPKRLRQVNPDAYTPHLISIGPFHHNEPGLSDMNEHKWRYTLSLLRRAVPAAEPPRQRIDHAMLSPPLVCGMNIIKNAQTEIRDRYAATIDLPWDDLVKMLLLDACFILELLFRYSEKEFSEKVQSDPVFQSEWMLSTLRRDLALLENQIPFFILNRLFGMVLEHNVSLRADYLTHMAFNFFFQKKPDMGDSRIQDCKHLLDLLLTCHLPWPPRIRPFSSGNATRPRAVNIPNIMSFIDRAGGSISKDSNDKNPNLFNVKFARGELQLPTYHIHEWSDSLLRNLMAYEYCIPNYSNTKRRHYMVSYIVLMGQLMNQIEDVEMLKKKGIITVELGGSEDVTNFFQDICKQAVVVDFYFQEICEELEKYYKSKIRGYFVELKQTNFKNPWTIISLLAGFLLLGFSLVQLIFTIIRGKK